MSLLEELQEQIDSVLRERWSTTDGRVVPDTIDVPLGNSGVQLEGTVLYADLAESTQLVQKHTPQVAAEVYKTFLYCCSKVIRYWNGTITAFDGDRVMAVFIGGSKNSSATKCALTINFVTQYLVAPSVRGFYSMDIDIRHAVGVDTSALFVARTGIRGSNDLVWVGRAANYAAKLAAARHEPYRTWITADVFNVLHESARVGANGEMMWTPFTWTSDHISVYGSQWHWRLS